MVREPIQWCRRCIHSSKLLTIAVLLCATSAAGDARRITWESFLEPVRSICLVEVVAARELLDERPEPVEHPDGTHEISIRPAQMVSTVQTERTLNGECPPFAELRWEVGMALPAFNLPLDEVRSWFLLFLDGPYEMEGDLPRFRISPRYAWKRRVGFTPDDESVTYFETQHLAVPAELRHVHPLRSYFPGGYVVYYSEVVTQDGLFELLTSLDLAPSNEDHREEQP